MDINQSSTMTPPRITAEPTHRKHDMSLIAGDLQSVGSIGTASDGAGDAIAKRTPASQARNFGRGQSSFGPGLASKM